MCQGVMPVVTEKDRKIASTTKLKGTDQTFVFFVGLDGCLCFEEKSAGDKTPAPIEQEGYKGFVRVECAAVFVRRARLSREPEM